MRIILFITILLSSGCQCSNASYNPMTKTYAHWPMCGWE